METRRTFLKGLLALGGSTLLPDLPQAKPGLAEAAAAVIPDYTADHLAFRINFYLRQLRHERARFASLIDGTATSNVFKAIVSPGDANNIALYHRCHESQLEEIEKLRRNLAALTPDQQARFAKLTEIPPEHWQKADAAWQNAYRQAAALKPGEKMPVRMVKRIARLHHHDAAQSRDSHLPNHVRVYSLGKPHQFALETTPESESALIDLIDPYAVGTVPSPQPGRFLVRSAAGSAWETILTERTKNHSAGFHQRASRMPLPDASDPSTHTNAVAEIKLR